ncbi:MAG TPA: hypothetical protein ENI61_01815 [Ignavibacteria bacterium]|nr:hypothetical protein [Ignavibacteria bacterium]
MEPDEKKLLEETLELVKENNKIIKKLYTSMRVSRFFRVIYWTVIIGSMLGAYYYFQPLIDSLKESFGGIMSLFGKSQSVVDSIPDISSLLKK